MSNIPLSIRASRVIRTMISVALAMLIMLSVIPRFQVFAVSVSDKGALASNLSSNANVELTEDIDASGWTTVSEYTGTLNGNGHKIYNLSTGLITTLSGSVKNVGLIAADDGATTSGLLAKTFNGSGKVEGTYVYGTIITTGDTVGAMIGSMTGGTVERCFSCVSMSGSAKNYAGGLIGRINNTNAKVTSCYSSGYMSMTNASVRATGFGYKSKGTVEYTYSSMQMIKRNPFSKPSGVNGLYDNQLGILRESISNKGLSTLELMKTTKLSDAFAVTTTAYPALKCFENSMWDEETANIVDVSTAAAAFSDVAGITRYEPDGVGPRADYLIAQTYVDRTNINSLTWSIDSTACKVFDTVPKTSLNSGQSSYLTGTSADLLRSRLEFSGTGNAWMTAASGNKVRKWYLVVNTTKNPYFNSGNGSSSSNFGVSSETQLDNVRYYSMLSPCYYRQTKDINDIGTWVPIANFSGTYDGGSKALNTITIADNGQSNLGVFGSTQSGATIKALTLTDVTASSTKATRVGCLIGYANSNTTVSDVLIKGTANSIVASAGSVGGVVGGSAEGLKLTNALVSVRLSGKNVGGLVGYTEGITLSTSGVTGLVTGTQYIGGLIGQTSDTSTVNHCYSTATVIGDSVSTTSYAGGLVGDATSCTLSNSYCAGLADAPSFTKAAPLVGNSGTVSDNVYFDALYAAGGLTSADLISKNISSSFWVTSTGYYPQIKTFATTARYQNLSKVSTVPVYHQLYWPNIAQGDVTTGWIDDDLLNTPTVLIDYSDSGTVKMYTVNSGHGFQPAASQRRVVLQSTDIHSDGVRVFGVTSPNLIPLSYTTSGTTNSSVHVELYYSNDKIAWTAFHVVSNGATSKEVYSIPKGCYVKAVVRTKDDYEVSSVSFASNGTTDTVMTAQNGAYISNSTFSNAVAVNIVLTAATPDWGLRRESY